MHRFPKTLPELGAFSEWFSVKMLWRRFASVFLYRGIRNGWLDSTCLAVLILLTWVYSDLELADTHMLHVSKKP